MTFRTIVFEILEEAGYSYRQIVDCFDTRASPPFDVAEFGMEVMDCEQQNIRLGFLTMLKTGKFDRSFYEAVERCKAHNQMTD